MWPCSPPHIVYTPHTSPSPGTGPESQVQTVLLSLLSRDGQRDVAETVGV